MGDMYEEEIRGAKHQCYHDLLCYLAAVSLGLHFLQGVLFGHRIDLGSSMYFCKGSIFGASVDLLKRVEQ